MIKEKQLSSFMPTVKVMDPDTVITLDKIEHALSASANRYGLPVSFYRDSIKYGGFLSSNIVDCLVMFNPNHSNDYFNFCISLTHQGNITFIDTNLFGRSQQMEKVSRSEWASQDRQGKTLSYKIGSKVGVTIANIGKSSSKLQEEQQYYNLIEEILHEVYKI